MTLRGVIESSNSWSINGKFRLHFYITSDRLIGEKLFRKWRQSHNGRKEKRKAGRKSDILNGAH